ncbi:MAG: hypothetical protein ACPF8V_08170, partial [Luteibaculum sp.]
KRGDRYTEGGYVEKLDFESFKQDQKPLTGKINPDQVIAFEDLIHQIKKQGIEIVFVETPVTQQYYAAYNRIEYDSITTDLDLVNMNALYTWPDSLFYDSQHLTPQGVKLMNERLIDFLKNR